MIEVLGDLSVYERRQERSYMNLTEKKYLIRKMLINMDFFGKMMGLMQKDQIMVSVNCDITFSWYSAGAY